MDRCSICIAMQYTVARKQSLMLTTTWDIRRCDRVCTLLRHIVEGCLNAHLLGGAGHMNGHIVLHLGPLQLVHEVSRDEFNWLI